MHSHFLENYSEIDSPIHRAPTWLKMTICVGLIVVCVTLPIEHFLIFTAIAMFQFLVTAASLVPGLFILKRLIFLEPIVLAAAMLSLFQPDGGRIFAALVVRSSLCITCLTLLANTTPLGEMLVVMKKLRLPSLLITTIALMHRYLFVLLEESQRMRRARASRTFDRSRASAWKSLATVCSQLFVRSTERAERVYAAMCARGWK